jgi:selenoprotein W-related protein
MSSLAIYHACLYNSRTEIFLLDEFWRCQIKSHAQLVSNQGIVTAVLKGKPPFSQQSIKHWIVFTDLKTIAVSRSEATCIVPVAVHVACVEQDVCRSWSSLDLSLISVASMITSTLEIIGIAILFLAWLSFSQAYVYHPSRRSRIPHILISRLSSSRLLASPRVEIEYCTGCRWMLRSAWLAQELLTTFESSIGEVALIPAKATGASGTFIVRVEGQTIWDRKNDSTKGFPEAKVLKQLVRDVIDPQMSLGHSDANPSKVIDIQ